MNKLEIILSKYPSYYATEDTASNIYNLTKAFADELELVLEQISRANDMIGIDTTRDIDLVYRWGNLLNLPILPSETLEQYRARLKNSVVMLSGGTAAAIKFSIAVALGINNDPILTDNTIRIYDAWEYDGEVPIDPEIRTPGYIVVDINMDGQPYSSDTEQRVINSSNDSKAAGVAIHFIIRNFTIIYYYQLADLFYANLASLYYNTLGAE